VSTVGGALVREASKERRQEKGRMLCGRPSNGPGRQDHWSSEEEEDDDGISSRILAPHPIESDRPKHRASRMIAISLISRLHVAGLGAMESIPLRAAGLGVGWKLVSRGGRATRAANADGSGSRGSCALRNLSL